MPATQSEKLAENERWERDFETTYGQGKWVEFCRMIWSDTRPHVVATAFPGKAGNPMSKPIYYKWEARAKMVKP